MAHVVQNPVDPYAADFTNPYNAGNVSSHPPVQLVQPTAAQISQGVLRVSDDAIRTKDVAVERWIDIAMALAVIGIGIFVAFTTLGAGLILIGLGLAFVARHGYHLSKQEKQDKVVGLAAEYVTHKALTRSQGDRAIELGGVQAIPPHQRIQRLDDLRGGGGAAHPEPLRRPRPAARPAD